MADVTIEDLPLVSSLPADARLLFRTPSAPAGERDKGILAIDAVAGAAGLPAPGSLGALVFGLVDRTWKNAGSAGVPPAAVVLRVDCYAEDVRGSYEIGAALWRTLTAAAVSDAPAAAERARLMSRIIGLAERTLWIGRGGANIPLIAWDGGASGAAAAKVEVFYS